MVVRETDLVRLETMAVADRLRWKEVGNSSISAKANDSAPENRIIENVFFLILLSLIENTIDWHQSATRAP